MRTKSFFAHNNAQGRTLLELMVAMAIGLVILASLGAVYVATTSAGRQSTSTSRMNEDASIAFYLLGGGVRMAGYSPPLMLVLPGGAIIDGVQKTAPDRNFVGAAIRGCDHGFVDARVASFTNLACQTADTTRSAALAIRFEGDGFNTTPIANTSTTGAPPDATDCLNQRVPQNTPSALSTIINDASKDKYALVESRFTASSGGSSETPELKCGGNGGNSLFNPDPMTQFIENMQMRYGVAKDGASRDVAQYTTAAQVDAFSGGVDDRWSRVINVRICMVMRSQDKQAGVMNYIDCDGESVNSVDGYARRAFTTFYALRNRSGFLTP
ncbi:MAG: PilW family protein [Comamonas sp.]